MWGAADSRRKEKGFLGSDSEAMVVPHPTLGCVLDESTFKTKKL